MASLRYTTCNCCNKPASCVVITARVLPEFAICKGCDNSGTYLKLSTYKPSK